MKTSQHRGRMAWRTLAVVAGLSAFALASSASAETVRVGKAGATAFSFVPVDVGIEAGIFKKNGLDLTVSSFGGEGKVQQAMAADGVDIGLSSGPGLVFVAKGAPVKGIAAMAGPPLLFAVVANGDGPVKSAADLKGKKVGISGFGSVTNWLVTEISRKEGWGNEGITQVSIGNDNARIAALKTKAVDAAIVNIAVALNFMKSSNGKIVARFGDFVKDFHLHVIFATDKSIKEKPEMLRAFMKGWNETIAYMRSHKAETVKVASKVMNTNPETTGSIYDELMPMFSDTGRFSQPALATLSRSFVDMKELPKEPDMKALIDESFLPK